MKVLLINGSPHAKGSTYTALHEMEKVFTENGIEAEIVHIGNKDIRGCVACGACSKLGKCAFSDMVNEVAPKFEEADGLVVGSPVYYASANATLIAFLDRLFYRCRIPGFGDNIIFIPKFLDQFFFNRVVHIPRIRNQNNQILLSAGCFIIAFGLIRVRTLSASEKRHRQNTCQHSC